MWRNNGYRFAFKGVKCDFLASSTVASDFRLTCNKELLMCCLGFEASRELLEGFYNVA